MIIRISIANEYGWSLGNFWVADGSDRECYAQPKTVCRSRFWALKTGLPLIEGRALTWEVVPDERVD